MSLIALTMGDATGIGPEIIIKTFAERDFIAKYPSVVIGDLGVLQRTAQSLGVMLNIAPLQAVTDAQPTPGKMDVLTVSHLPNDLPMGKVAASAGHAAYLALRSAISLAQNGAIAGICTAPIHKEAFAAAGVPYPGHTEMLATLTGSADYAMLLAAPQLRAILVTVHCSLHEAIARLTLDSELRIIRLAQRSLLAMGIRQPRIAVAGLNPHAGEGGLFGNEDQDIIAPAIAAARREGIDASGPHPGDTVFMQARRGRYDIVVAQYHDQGLIPIKLLGVEDGVNVTVGLPFVRTSPDHGTAFDIAGQGIADPSSLKCALALAHQLALTQP